ncbi:alpha/beta hydrolase fold domain-containing protein [Apiospora kogelbergensis]|uniref:Alpha/beta hydrolase fold domain-containing protein n=1 Tax=Apiospora kogelbergensis TaxID=1337665 RepID=A0AAW0QVB2_9PEZI
MAAVVPWLRGMLAQAKGVVAESSDAAVGHSSSGANFHVIPSPRTSAALRGLTQAERDALPYPPDGALPGSRDVPTPYGSVRVYEWGPKDGERVLLIAGISTPTLSLGDLAWEMSERGYRVMLFDYFGRGYSDAPVDVEYGARLYATQMLLVLASSQPGGWERFHLVGYSLGGCLAVAFARHFPHLIESLTLIAGAGLIRPHHVDWKGWLLYQSGLLPEALVKYFVHRRIRPSTTSSPTDVMAAESKSSPSHQHGHGNATGSDADGGQGFDSAPISRRRPGVSVADVVAHQIDTHAGFVHAFTRTMRHAPIYAPQADWVVLRELLSRARERRRKRREKTEKEKANDGKISWQREEQYMDDDDCRMGLVKGKVLLVLGSEDPVIVPGETIEDAEAVLGREGLQHAVLAAGHELPITQSREVADVMHAFFQQ